MKVGDTVRLTGLPDVRDDKELKTRTLFEKCVGRVFVIAGIDRPEGIPFALLRLDVGHVLGRPDYKHTIWVEQQYVELANEVDLDSQQH